MSEEQKQDEGLIQFLKTNQPEAPSASEKEADRIYAAIERGEQPQGDRKTSIRFLVPVAIAAGIALTYLRPGPEPIDEAALAAFLDDAMAAAYEIDNSDDIESDWVMLAEMIAAED